MQTLYIDKISFFSLLRIIFTKIRYTDLFYFDASSFFVGIASFLHKIGILRAKPRRLLFQAGDIRDDKGECQFVRMTEDAKYLSENIAKENIARTVLFQKMSVFFERDEILLFFEKSISEILYKDIVLLHAARWHQKEKRVTEKEFLVFFWEQQLWFGHLGQYAKDLGIKLICYRSLTPSIFMRHMCWRKAFVFVKNILVRSVCKIFQFRKEAVHKVSVARVDNRIPRIAGWYTGRQVTSDPSKRSDFFWFQHSDIPRQQLLIYFHRPDVPATEDDLHFFAEHGIQAVALSPQATLAKAMPVWLPGKTHSTLIKKYRRILFKAFLSESISSSGVSFFTLIYLLYFVKHYAYWYDFFRSYNIKINVNPNYFTSFHIPQNTALRHCGGISSSYQISNVWFVSSLLARSLDLLFAFGPYYQNAWNKTGSLIKKVVYSGYITDYSFKAVAPAADRLRSRLHDKGTRFIISFFDENSSDDRMAVIPNERSIQVYRYLLEKVLEDRTLGLICKPGYPRTLSARLAPLRDLIEKAKETGRCVFMDEGRYLTDIYPAEAAQASDVCVTFLLGGAVAIESYLAGTPTVFLDLEQLYSHPLYESGKGRILFNSCDELFSAIEKYRGNHEGIPGFGDLSTWTEKIDCYKDGFAAVRIGQYLNWLLAKFSQGRTREEALRFADKNYTKRWGLAADQEAASRTMAYR